MPEFVSRFVSQLSAVMLSVSCQFQLSVSEDNILRVVSLLLVLLSQVPSETEVRAAS